MLNHFLIPYVPLKGHKDPDLRELAYGHSGSKGETLKNKISKGSYLFFHTKIGSSKYITGYIVVEKILSGKEAQSDQSISCDGQYDEWLFVGNKNKSKRLRKPLPFDRHLAKKLSLDINFDPYEKGLFSELAVIGWATRSHRQLTDKDVSALVDAIQEYEENTKIENSQDVQYHIYFYDECQDIIPLDEVHKVKELEIQKLLRKNPSVIEKGLKVIDYEKSLPDGDRLDLLLEDEKGSIIVAELKGPDGLTDEIPTQIGSYIRDIEKNSQIGRSEK